MKHYSDGKLNPFEDKPIDIKNFGNITTYEITAGRHGDYYKFEDLKQVGNDFLNKVRSKFRPSGSVIIECVFSNESLQLAMFQNSVPILDIRYWSTETYKANFSNDCMFFSLREDILRRVINNGMSESSSQFNKLVYLNLKIMGENRAIVQ